MSPEITVALIGLVGSGVGSLVGIIISSKLTQYRLEQLEKRMGEALADVAKLESRVYSLEMHNEVQDERMRVANHRIDDLEKGGGKK